MKISFLVTYYNQEKYVHQSLDSILAVEKPEEWEILVGDDGSSDHTIEIVNTYISSDPEHIHLYIMPRNPDVKYDSVLRASANRLNLLEHCTGDCFCVLDGDDYYCDTQFVTDSIDIINNNPDISIVAFGYKLSKADEQEDDKLLPDRTKGYMNSDEYIRKLYLHAGACVHRILWDIERVVDIKRIGFFDDNDIVINSLNYGNMYYIDRSIYVYRQLDDSVYHRMSNIEKAVLNVQGYDVDKMLVNKEFHDALMDRYSSSLLTMFLYKKRLNKTLGNEKYTKYVDGCNNIENSICKALLLWDRQPHDVKCRIQKKFLIVLYKQFHNRISSVLINVKKRVMS